MKHTDGPWRVYEPTRCVVGPEPERILVCEMRGFRGAEVEDANARLIAAAPDMLASLEAQQAAEDHFANCDGMGDRCGGNLSGDVWHCAKYCRLRAGAAELRKAAIARAKGGAT